MTTSPSRVMSEATRSVQVWPGYIRVMHWALAICVLGAWILSGDIRWIHQCLGYAAVILAGIRTVAGFTGRGFVRFSNFMKSPVSTLRYMSAIMRGKEKRYIGHNPAGGLMILALLLAISLTGLTGWLLTTDRFFGDDLLEDLHQTVANGIIFLVALHLGGVLIASVRHKENLVLAMITGRKRSG